jgi:hypothetical protein
MSRTLAEFICVPVPLTLPDGVKAFGVHASGERYAVQIYPWPDPTLPIYLGVDPDGFPFARVAEHPGERRATDAEYGQLLMVGGIWGETSNRVPIRIIAPIPCWRMGEVEVLADWLIRCGWSDCKIEREQPKKPRRKKLKAKR